MTVESVTRRKALQGLLTAGLPLGTFGCARANADSLVVGGLPVTCNLTLPVACVAKGISNRSSAAGAKNFPVPVQQVQWLA